MNKYKSCWTDCNQRHKHQSKKEAVSCNILHSIEKSRIIKNLKVQPEYELQPAFTSVDGKKVRSIIYRADFSFYDNGNKKFRVIDIKGFPSPLYQLKRKMFDYIMRDKKI